MERRWLIITYPTRPAKRDVAWYEKSCNTAPTCAVSPSPNLTLFTFSQSSSSATVQITLSIYNMLQTLQQHQASSYYIVNNQQTLVNMAKLSVRSSKRSVSDIVKFKFVEKLQKRLLPGRSKEASVSNSTYVPEDVKEGHFAVIAEGGEEHKRFVLPLTCLSNPKFLKLLEQAEEEYGFDHEGAVTIPCRPSDLERILAHQWHHQPTQTSSPYRKSIVF